MERQGVLRDFANYVILNILGQMAYSCYTMADTFLVAASLGADGLTALNLAFPMLCLINGTGLMIGIGGGARYSIFKSRGESEPADRIFTGAACLAGVFALVYVAAGLFFSVPLVRLLGADDTMLPMTHTYLRTMLLFAPAFLFNHLLQCFVRNDGNPALSMAALVSGSVSDIALAYVFIFPLGMGIFGSILAAGLAPIISMLVISPYLFRRKNGFHLVAALPNGATARQILSTGVSPFLTEATSGIVMFLFNFLILRMAGNVGVAAFSVITVVSLVVVAIYTGLSQGIQPLISRNYGVRNEAKVKAVLNFSMFTMLLLSAAIYGTVFFGAEWIVAAFNSEGDPLLQSFAVSGMKLYFTACPFIGFNIVLSTFFLSAERPRPAQVISLLRGLIVLIPTALLLSSLLNMTGVWCAYPLTECVTALFGVGYCCLTGATKRFCTGAGCNRP